MIEMQNVRQDSPEYHRRWYFDDDFDLIIWHRRDGSLHGFQLCYDKSNDDEKALSWFAGRGLAHHRVDPGDESPCHNRSPMLTVSDGRLNMARLLATFGTSATKLPDALKSIVEEKIRDYGDTK